MSVNQLHQLLLFPYIFLLDETEQINLFLISTALEKRRRVDP